jgi:nucleoside-diphosphate-sugar epimerase
MNGKRILITGPLGHIGSKFIHNIKPGDFEEVILIDNLSTQRYPSLFNLPKGVNFNFIENDICTADLNKYFKDINVVVHLAAITDAAASVDRKEQVEEVNYYGTERVAKACVRNQCKLFFPSTTSVYGTQEEIVDESCSGDELKPQSPYADSKLRVEQLLAKLGRDEHLEFVICRFGTIFGISIGMRFHTAVNKFVWQACLGQPITVWRTAMNQKRPYLDLGDAVRAMTFMIRENIFTGEIYNVVTLNATVSDIISTITENIPALKVALVDAEIMNQLSYNVSNERFRALGFEFRGDIHKGIHETIALLNSAWHRT